MRTLQHTFYYPSRSIRYTLYHITDVHLGHAACDETRLMADIRAIADDPFALWGGGGDYCDFIQRKSDKRFRASAVAPWLADCDDMVGAQWRRFVQLVTPIADRCLYLTKGNHEDDILTYYERDVFEDICAGIAQASQREIRALALGWEGFVNLTFRRGFPEEYGGSWKMTLYTHHGAAGGRKQGGHALRMEEVMLTYDADLILMGHRHVRQIINKAKVSPSGSGVKLVDRLGVWGGSYLKPFVDDRKDGYPRDNYPQRKHLPPLTAGIVPIVIKPDVRRFEVTLCGGEGVARPAPSHEAVVLQLVHPEIEDAARAA